MTISLSPDHTPVAFSILQVPGLNAARTASYPYYLRHILKGSGVFAKEWGMETLGQNLSQPISTVVRDKAYLEAKAKALSRWVGEGGAPAPHAGDETNILITVGNAELDEATAGALVKWVEDGGIWISIAGVCDQEELLGVVVEKPAYFGFGGSVSTLGEGYLRPVAEHDCLRHLEIPLHYYNGIPVRATTAKVLAEALDVHGRVSNRHVLTVREAGKGLAICLACDLTGSVVTIQQGRGAVTRDGFPAPDGTAPVCDDVLKSGDAGALDWLLDRQPVPGVDGLHAYLQPIADQWNELLLRLIFSSAHRQQIPLPLLWLYPRNLPAIAHISLDTDHNVPEQGEKLYRVLEDAEVKATWCTILPGLPDHFMKMLHDTGHELAMHYDAMTEGLEWGAGQFSEQWRGLVTLFGGIEPVTNKNHYLRWEGDTDLWEWCISHGIQLDQSKGASKTGEAGFNFGTARPYFPVDFRGRVLDILELPTTTQDLEVFAPKALVDSLIRAVRRHHGILHLLFHPAHIDKPPVPVAIAEAVAKARATGMEWWTSANINTWERARHAARWAAYDIDSGVAELHSDIALPGATILWLKGKADENDPNARWGYNWQATVIDLPEKGTTKLNLN